MKETFKWILIALGLGTVLMFFGRRLVDKDSNTADSGPTGETRKAARPESAPPAADKSAPEAVSDSLGLRREPSGPTVEAFYRKVYKTIATIESNNLPDNLQTADAEGLNSFLSYRKAWMANPPSALLRLLEVLPEVKDHLYAIPSSKGLASWSLLQRECESLQDVIAGQKMTPLRRDVEQSPNFDPLMPAIDSFTNAISGYGVIVHPQSGFAFMGAPAQPADWERARQHPVTQGYWEGAFQLTDDSILVPGLRTIEAWARGEVPISDNDGILTAEEVGTLPLEGTWLVTLSACDTGDGEALAGEGVLGLRRGFIQAGAQNLLMTLWPINDQVTVQIMLEFYAKALASGDAPESLVEVQRKWLLKLRQEKGLLAAVNLAGPFILSSKGKAGPEGRKLSQEFPSSLNEPKSK